MSAVEQAHDRMARAREDDEKAQAKLNADLAEAREAAFDDFNDSEQGDVRRQIDEAERIMRLPTPEAHKALGTKPGDPTKGPSS